MTIKFSLVIPTYNEAKNIEKLCQKIIDVLDKIDLNFEIIIVDDDSPDKTWQVAQDLSKQDSRIKLIRRISKRGLATAVISGWNAAGGEILGVMDGDLQHPPEALEEMIKQISCHQEVDVVIASRYVAGGGVLNRRFWQIFRSRLAVLLGRIFIPKIFKAIKDPLSGYFILKKKVISGNQLKPVGYKILLEILAKGSYGKICEVPYVFAARVKGNTKAGWKECCASLFHLIKLVGNKGDYR